jgi:EpsI family protein
MTVPARGLRRAAGPPALLAGLVAGLATLLVLAHGRALLALAGTWDRNPMYSYGWLVLPIGLYMVWARRERLAAIPVTPAPWSGAAVLLVWLALMIAGRLGGVLLFEQLGLIVAVAGCVLALAGRPALRVVAPSIAYLLLMIPVWEIVTDPLQVPFQNLTAALALPLIEAAGVPVYRDGIFLTLPTARLEVARACSGVNYLIAVLALGPPMALLYLRSPVRRVVLVVSALVTATLSNAVRVTLIALLVTRDPDTPLHGPGHVLHGLFVAAVGYVTLFVVLAWLARGEAAQAAPEAAGTPDPAPAAAPRRLVPVALAVGALIGGTMLFLGTRIAAPVALTGSLDALPRQLGAWIADPLARPNEPRWWPQADQTLLRTYRHDRLAAEVFIGYFAHQRHPREVITPIAEPLHRDAVVETIAARGGSGLAVNRVITDDGPDRRLTLFWYDVDGRAVATPTGVKLRTAWNAMLHDRTNGAVISVSVPLDAQADVRAATAALEDLAVTIERALGTCLPGRDAARALLSARTTTGSL